MPLIPQIHLTENLILYVFLPALIFDAAMSLDVRNLVKNLVPILVLAAPGVVFATLLTGALVHWLTPLGWGPAMLFGALISTTDPVAVIATFKDLKAPERLTMLVDGESLFNDATAIVMFGIVGGMVADGSSLTGATAAYACLQFLWVFLGGFVVGCLFGLAGAFFVRVSHGGHVSLGVLFSICAAYGSFIVAQGMMGLSGVMAAVGAGMVISYMAKNNEDKATVQGMREFWPFASFFGNGLIFLFLGLTERYLLDKNLLAASGLYMVLAAVAVLVVRFLMIYGFVPLSNAIPGQEAISRPYRAVMVWGGLRGALPIGLAVSIRANELGIADSVMAVDAKKYIILFTVAVVIFTLFLQGTTIPHLMKRLGLVGIGEKRG